MDFKKPLTFNEFGKSGLEAWKAQALKELKKESLDSLQWKNKDNIILDPYYDSSRSSKYNRAQHQVNKENDYAQDARWWENRQEIITEDPEKTNKSILEALDGGADGIVLKGISKETDYKKILKNVKLEYCSISVTCSQIEYLQPFLSFINEPSTGEKIKGEIYWENIDSALEFLSEGWQDLPHNIRCFGFNDDDIVRQLLNTKKNP